MPCLLFLLLLSLQSEYTTSSHPPPTLNGENLLITVAQESGFVNIIDDHETTNKDGSSSLKFSGYIMDMIESIAERANFTYTIKTPSGFGSLCNDRLIMTKNETKEHAFAAKYRTQYKCGQSDVNDLPLSNYTTDMYLGLYYVTPERQLENQFTLPYHPPSTGTLTMFGTATGISNMNQLAQLQSEGEVGPACAAENAAYIDFLRHAYPDMQFVEVPNTEESFYNSLVNGVCSVIISDYPVATYFTLQQYQKGQCLVNGMPIGVIGQPMGYGLNQYAIGIRRDLDPHITHAISYWLNILMTCSPGDVDCPLGNLYHYYTGGTGNECGYVGKYPTNVSIGAWVGIVLGSLALVVLLVALWRMRRLKKRQRKRIERLQVQAAQEKAQLQLDHAHQAAVQERELNDYIAHEVRNPLAAALSACSFVISSLETSTSSSGEDDDDDKNLQLVLQDAQIINFSLHFMNDLLRNMLDMQRASSNQLQLHESPTNIWNDILQPVDTMLYQRGDPLDIRIMVECPPELHILGDKLRLKQILLNLGRNAAKFVTQSGGFIRFKAEVMDGSVQVSVEDSGPGIPLEKRPLLFTKFQESLDSLHQGTGIGLCLCQRLAQLMKATLVLDESYHSGIEGCPGARFVLQLNKLPLDVNDDWLEQEQRTDLDDATTSNKVNAKENHTNADAQQPQQEQIQQQLPENLSILFVDDDAILRKLFSRSIRKARPSWSVKEASNGETAIRMCCAEDDSKEFDLVFVDQYMASVERQLLGTETVRALRSKSVTSKICGLSANDVEQAFLEAGANHFLFKPFPCQPAALEAEMYHILFGTTTNSSSDSDSSSSKEEDTSVNGDRSYEA